MPSVAEQLRAAREAQGLSVHEVADMTKIRTDHIRALEEGTYDTFAAPVYVRGFVRTYAAILRLDVSQILTGLEAELCQVEQFRESLPLTSRPRGFVDLLMLQLSKVNWRVALPSLGLALVALLVILGYRTWRQFQSRDPLSKLGPGLYQPTQAVSGDALPLPPVAPKK
jgi:cytoskeletal protein RodZ